MLIGEALSMKRKFKFLCLTKNLPSIIFKHKLYSRSNGGFKNEQVKRCKKRRKEKTS
jgi:hypothetical protein